MKYNIKLTGFWGFLAILLIIITLPLTIGIILAFAIISIILTIVLLPIVAIGIIFFLMLANSSEFISDIPKRIRRRKGIKNHVSHCCKVPIKIVPYGGVYTYICSKCRNLCSPVKKIVED